MPVKQKEPLIMHPRPSSIVAALYTLRDLDTDVVILHGPPGCSFKHARLLEEDGMRVVTTSLEFFVSILPNAELNATSGVFSSSRW